MGEPAGEARGDLRLFDSGDLGAGSEKVESGVANLR